MPIIQDVTGGKEADRQGVLRVLGVAVAVIATLVIMAAASPAHAESDYARTHAIGISDNKPSTFFDPRLGDIGIRTARVVLPWNAISADKEGVAAWMDSAKNSDVQPLVAFDRTRGNQCPQRPCNLPSVKRFKREFKRFHKQYPKVRYFSPWNEANHPGQPTAKRPDRVADFHDVIMDVCKKCRVVAGDPLDTPGVGKWMKSYEKTLKREHRRKVTRWGLHNYISANYFSLSGTREALKATKADVWLTETGGIVQMLTFDETRLNYDEERAKRALEFAFKVMAKYPCRIKRMYVYNWQAAPNDRFDTGLIHHDGRARPGFEALTDALREDATVQQRSKRCKALRARHAKARKAGKAKSKARSGAKS